MNSTPFGYIFLSVKSIAKGLRSLTKAKQFAFSRGTLKILLSVPRAGIEPTFSP